MASPKNFGGLIVLCANTMRFVLRADTAGPDISYREQNKKYINFY